MAALACAEAPAGALTDEATTTSQALQSEILMQVDPATLADYLQAAAAVDEEKPALQGTCVITNYGSIARLPGKRSIRYATNAADQADPSQSPRLPEAVASELAIGGSALAGTPATTTTTTPQQKQPDDDAKARIIASAFREYEDRTKHDDEELLVDATARGRTTKEESESMGVCAPLCRRDTKGSLCTLRSFGDSLDDGCCWEGMSLGGNSLAFKSNPQHRNLHSVSFGGTARFVGGGDDPLSGVVQRHRRRPVTPGVGSPALTTTMPMLRPFSRSPVSSTTPRRTRDSSSSCSSACSLAVVVSSSARGPPPTTSQQEGPSHDIESDDDDDDDDVKSVSRSVCRSGAVQEPLKKSVGSFLKEVLSPAAVSWSLR